MKVTTPVAIALGSNLGDRQRHLAQAVEILTEDVLLSSKCSKIYESPPWGYENQPKFLNMVVVGLSDWNPHALLNFFRDYENTNGRERRISNGPRTIDIDLIAYGDQITNDNEVIVPHSRFRDRDFVLLPLNDVWPTWCDPVSKKLVSDLLSSLREQGELAAKTFGVLPPRSV